MDRKFKGSSLIIIAAFLYGINVVVAKIAYNEGANTIYVLAMRFLIASVLLWIYGLVFRGKDKVRVDRSQAFVLFVIGGIVYDSTKTSGRFNPGTAWEYYYGLVSGFVYKLGGGISCFLLLPELRNRADHAGEQVRQKA